MISQSSDKTFSSLDKGTRNNILHKTKFAKKGNTSSCNGDDGHDQNKRQ